MNKPVITKRKLLIIDDEQNMRHMLSTLLKKTGYEIDSAADGYEGLQFVRNNHYDFILCDIKMPNMDGMDFLRESKQLIKSTTVIMMSAYGTIDTALNAIKMGAYDYISKPFKRDEVYFVLKKAEERENLKKENIYLKKKIGSIEEKYAFGNMVAKSDSMQSVFRIARKVADYKTTVLITGESGTGKELVAKGIHFGGERARGPFVPVNCGGIPENLLESEFFGHVKGSFTGADRNKTGLFEDACQGTIFLDEIGELPLSLQVKLLRVLQEGEIRQVGSSKTKKVDARVIAATAKNLEDEISRGNFREDLFYRINVMPIKLPPLRDRIQDISLLCKHFLNRFNKSLGKDVTSISSDAMSILLKHKWPGNVRELENVIERGMIFSETEKLLSECLPDDLVTDIKNDFYDGDSLKKSKKILEKRMIIRALEKTGGNRTHAARRLEISHPSLLSKIKAYGIK